LNTPGRNLAEPIPKFSHGFVKGFVKAHDMKLKRPRPVKEARYNEKVFTRVLTTYVVASDVKRNSGKLHGQASRAHAAQSLSTFVDFQL
jgi:hypothetical protein